MLLKSQITKKIAVLDTLLVSALVTFAAVSSAIKAVAAPPNPCPGIYYEEPFNSNYLVPQGCPPNAATRLSTPSGVQSPATPLEGAAPQQLPSPESQGNTIATVALENGTFGVQVTNNTNAVISYQVVGNTDRRYLRGGESATLRGIPAPATILFVRQDNGFVEIVPTPTDKSGMLNISLNEDVNPLDGRTSAMRVHSNGRVSLN